LINDGTVTFAWHGDGSLVGTLKHRPYGNGHHACAFLEELTADDVRRMRSVDPASFRALPPTVQQGADRGGSPRIAGLCGVHLDRPMVCRAFPFARAVAGDPLFDAA